MKQQRYVVRFTNPQTDAEAAMASIGTNINLALRQYVAEGMMTGHIVDNIPPSLSEDNLTLTVERVWTDTKADEFLNIMSLTDIRTTLTALPHVDEVIEYDFTEYSE